METGVLIGIGLIGIAGLIDNLRLTAFSKKVEKLEKKVEKLEKELKNK